MIDGQGLGKVMHAVVIGGVVFFFLSGVALGAALGFWLAI